MSTDPAAVVPSLAAAALAGTTVWLVLGPSPGGRRGAGSSAASGRGGGRAGGDPVVQRALVSGAAALAPVLLVGGLLGWLAAPVVMVLVHRTLRRRVPADVRRRQEQVARSLPQIVDLLAVTLAAGAAPGAAVTTVTAAVEGPVADELSAVERALSLGRDPAGVWRDVARRPGMGPLGRSMARAVETGASVSEALHRLADDLQVTERAEAESRARSVGVRAAAPLGLCLLPAFVLIGVVPLVAGTVGVLLQR